MFSIYLFSIPHSQFSISHSFFIRGIGPDFTEDGFIEMLCFFTFPGIFRFGLSSHLFQSFFRLPADIAVRIEFNGFMKKFFGPRRFPKILMESAQEQKYSGIFRVQFGSLIKCGSGLAELIKLLFLRTTGINQA